MIVLGLNSVFHESSAALVVDGHVVSAAEEERFTRRKHAKAAAVDNAHVLPEESIRFCLAEACIKAADIDRISYSYDPGLRSEKFLIDTMSVPGDWGSQDGENIFVESLSKVPDALREALGADIPITYVRHHLAHAASVYYTSCPRDAALLVADGIGENAATVLFSGADGRLEVLEEIEYPHSLGFLWEKLSTFLGFTEYDACKVMGLAGYGDASEYARAYSDASPYPARPITLHASYSVKPRKVLSFSHRKPSECGYSISSRTSSRPSAPENSTVAAFSPMPSATSSAASLGHDV